MGVAKIIYKFIARRLSLLVYRFLDSSFFIKHFHRSLILKKAQKIQQKKIIRVVFELHDISKWKTESLYKEMLKNPRFEPIIVTTINTRFSYLSTCSMYVELIEELEKRGIPFIQADKNKSICDIAHPDIVFPQEPYDFVIPGRDYYHQNRKPLYCFVNYAANSLVIPELINEPLHNFVWMRFFENQAAADSVCPYMTNGGINNVVTGLPFYDVFLNPEYKPQNPWKKQGSQKKKIIWAPHHTIPHTPNVFEQSTFLDVAETMLELAEKYKEIVQWAFKPHPVLYTKLIDLWGAERADAYYAKWRNLEYAQLETGSYLNLFITSDALIHDCASFTVEYQYTHKPALYLLNGGHTHESFNGYAKEAFDLHYKCHSRKDIESFIENVVINENDSLQEERNIFFKNRLLPPNQKSASENIIDSILMSK